MSRRDFYIGRETGSIPQLQGVPFNPIFFSDNFEDGVIDPAKWTTVSGNHQETGGRYIQTGQSGGNSITSVATFAPGCKIEWSGILPSTSQSYTCYGLVVPSVGELAFFSRWENVGSVYVKTIGSGWTGSLGINTGQHNWKIEWLLDGTQKYYIDDVLRYTNPVAETRAAKFYTAIYDSGVQVTLDNITATYL